MSTTDDAATAAHRARAALELLLAEAPVIESLLPPGYGAAAERYLELLLRANELLNLTRVIEPEAIARLHLLDALAALPLLDAWAPDVVVDLGSGGGVPAIPLALARPDIRWTLVDSVRKKTVVLRGFAEALVLRNVTVLANRAEALGRDIRYREHSAIVTARACAALPVLAELALPLLRIGGRLLAWKGPLTDDDEEVRRGGEAIRLLGGGRLQVFETGLPALGGHRFVIVKKEQPTPALFPRRPGEPGRRPLG